MFQLKTYFHIKSFISDQEIFKVGSNATDATLKLKHLLTLANQQLMLKIP